MALAAVFGNECGNRAGRRWDDKGARRETGRVWSSERQPDIEAEDGANFMEPL
jgi:hypothetical protein